MGGGFLCLVCCCICRRLFMFPVSKNKNKTAIIVQLSQTTGQKKSHLVLGSAFGLAVIILLVFGENPLAYVVFVFVCFFIYFFLQFFLKKSRFLFVYDFSEARLWASCTQSTPHSRPLKHREVKMTLSGSPTGLSMACSTWWSRSPTFSFNGANSLFCLYVVLFRMLMLIFVFVFCLPCPL